MARKTKARRPGPGRPSKLTPKVQAQICAAISEAGNFRETAAALAGVTDRTLRSWCAKGKAAREAGEESEYLTFLEALEEAEAKIEDELVRTVKQASLAPPGAIEWRAAVWLLERRASRNWLVKHKLDVVGPGVEGGRRTGVAILPVIEGDTVETQESNNNAS